MAVYCANDYYCISNTGFSTLDDNYTQSGTYNLRDYFVGGTNGYYIYFTGSLWCLSDTLGGSCFLQGKYPYSGLCPDLSTSYVNATVCATPTPTQTIGCGNLSFDAIFAINITNTPSVTPTMTRTPTITPSVTITNFCPFIGVSASVSYISPTPTPTITPTPKTVAQRNRAPVISCSFNGDVTFTTVNSVISCPVSRQFQDCSTGFIYRTSSSVTNPSGGDFSQFMIFEGLVDGVYRCVTYLGLDSNNQAGNQITLQVGPIGYSNLGQCNLCFNAGTLTPTPTPTLTPTPTVTPSGGLCFPLCSVIYISSDSQQIYTLDLGSFSYQPLPFSNVGVRWDIAHTTNKVFTSVFNNIREYNISSCPFSSTFVREINITSSFARVGDGLFAINDTTLLSWELYSVNSSGWSNDLPIRIMRINLNSNNNIDTSNVNFLFDLPIDRIPAGDLILTTNNKLILFTRDIDNDVFISQFNYPSGGSPEVDIQIPQYSYVYPGLLHLSLFVDNGQMYIIDGDGLVHSIDNTYPYTITEYFNFGFNDVGTSQIQSCINVSFIPYTPQVTYYIYKLCNDIVGPQNYIYQTSPGFTTVVQQTFYNITLNNCWSYQGTSTSIPQNTTDDIVVFQGNYFTEVGTTLYTNCTACIGDVPCTLPTNLIQLNFYNSFGTTPPIITNSLSNQEICDIYSDLYNEVINPQTAGATPRRVISLSIGSQIYSQVVNNPCDCDITNGKYFVTPGNVNILSEPEFVYIVTVTDCFITEIVQCYGEDGLIINSSSGGSGGGTEGTNPGGGTNPEGGPSPTSNCQCTAVKTISGFQSTAFYTDCDGNPAQITVPANTGIPSTSTACFCRQAGTEVTGPVILEACQTIQGGSSGSSNITNNCLDQISCS
jgi:hypothetical protein